MPINNDQPSLVITEVINTQGVYPQRSGITSGDEEYVGQITFFAGNFAPYGTASANGQLMAIQSNTALFSLLGTYYGGNGTSNFALPNLAGHRAIGDGQGPGLNYHTIGESAGSNFFNLYQSNLTYFSGGTSQPIDNEDPYLTMHWMIQVDGVYPSQSGMTDGINSAYSEPIGAVSLFAGNFTPPDCLPCDGRLVNISDYEALFTILGTTYGGDGITTFALPDLRGRSIVGAGTRPGGGTYYIGEEFGTETDTITNLNMPTQMGGGGQALNNDSPSLVMNYLIALTGVFPSRNAIGVDDAPTSTSGNDTYLGEIVPFAGNFAPQGFAICAGQLLSIQQNQALFALLGTMYGGNGVTTFALPDLRGRTITGAGYDSSSGQTYTVGEVYGSDTSTITMSDIPSLSFTGSGTLYGGDQADLINGQSGNDIIHGNGGNDYLYGYAGNDTLDGGSGADTMTGGIGNDTYIVDNPSDSIVENANEGTDTVQASVNYTLSANVENLILIGAAVTGTGNSLDNTLTGNAYNNTLYGLDGNDLIDGGAGDDTMYGGTGNDTYIVDSLSDSIVENANEGTDTVQTSLDNYVLSAANVENLTLTGSAVTGTGNNLDNTILGNANNNILYGLGGNDWLDGGAGNDTMYGGTGDDTYIVYASGDTVVENANEGIDSVHAGISYTLTDNVERLVLLDGAQIGKGNALDNLIQGNGADNLLYGYAGNDTLDGKAGADTMYGGTGNDTFYVDNINDQVIENNGEGTDLIYSSVTYSLAGQFVENLTLTGSAGDATGNSLANVLVGNGSANILDGGYGNDTLTGGGGADTFLFKLSSGQDTITDFSAAQGDMIKIHQYTQGTVNLGMIHQVGSDVQIDLGGGNVITVLNATNNATFQSHIIW